MFKTRIRPSWQYWCFGSAICLNFRFRICRHYCNVGYAWSSFSFFRHCWSFWWASYFSTSMKFRICLMFVFALFRNYWSFGCAWCSFSYALCSLCWVIAGNWRKCRTRCSSPCTSLALLSIFARFRILACGTVRFLKLDIVYGKLRCMLWTNLG